MKNSKTDKTKAKTTKRLTIKQRTPKPAVEILDLSPDDAQADRVGGGTHFGHEHDIGAPRPRRNQRSAVVFDHDDDHI
ncbi:MAG TPA: hypothetical protein VJ810_22195 [Blastocatellia bacterium]|nr:hypothetical protein [Blastocatellia bacterium]